MLTTDHSDRNHEILRWHAGTALDFTFSYIIRMVIYLFQNIRILLLVSLLLSNENV